MIALIEQSQDPTNFLKNIARHIDILSVESTLFSLTLDQISLICSLVPQMSIQTAANIIKHSFQKFGNQSLILLSSICCGPIGAEAQQVIQPFLSFPLLKESIGESEDEIECDYVGMFESERKKNKILKHEREEIDKELQSLKEHYENLIAIERKNRKSTNPAPVKELSKPDASFSQYSTPMHQLTPNQITQVYETMRDAQQVLAQHFLNSTEENTKLAGEMLIIQEENEELSKEIISLREKSLLEKAKSLKLNRVNEEAVTQCKRLAAFIKGPKDPFQAADDGDQLVLLAFFLKEPESIKAKRPDDGSTLGHHIAASGSTAAMQLFIDAGGDLGAADNHKSTVADWSGTNQMTEFIRNAKKDAEFTPSWITLLSWVIDRLPREFQLSLNRKSFGQRRARVSLS
jgi:hypothetical protein